MDAQRIGIISDTHGLTRPEALEALRGVRLIIHAGDVGKQDVLEELQTIAPVRAVRGNTDKGPWAEALHWTDMVEIGQLRIYVLHDFDRLDLDPAAAGIGAIVVGHSHRPCIRRLDRIWIVNPGSAGPRRFHLPVSLAMIQVKDGKLEPRIVDLGNATGARKVVFS